MDRNIQRSMLNNSIPKCAQFPPSLNIGRRMLNVFEIRPQFYLNRSIDCFDAIFADIRKMASWAAVQRRLPYPARNPILETRSRLKRSRLNGPRVSIRQDWKGNGRLALPMPPKTAKNLEPRWAWANGLPRLRLYSPGTEIRSKAQNPKSKVGETSNIEHPIVSETSFKKICAIIFPGHMTKREKVV
jgi:hypothetical protein